ncbi:MAG TPA: hypothetical protein PL070_17480 [Flavobacteriales bacterium]|nr:hypothetical protein [Flavobacteriales bacterium]
MDLKTLKLELLERIAQLDDETRLLALKRLLDAPRDYGIPNEHLSVVKEGEQPYARIEDRNYTAAEVRALLAEVLQSTFPGSHGTEGISDVELAELDRRHQARLSGQSKGLPLKESMDRLRARGRS